MVNAITQTAQRVRVKARSVARLEGDRLSQRVRYHQNVGK